MKFKLGCDPEILLVNKENLFISAIDTFGGSKHVPNKLEVLGDGFAVQEDNVALEFNIPPSETSESFTRNLNKILKYLADSAVDNFGLYFSNQSATIFPEEQLQDIRALEFGCEPDYNAWTGRRNPRPAAADPRLRSAGGHIHIGLEDPSISKENKRRLIQLMDLHLAIPSIIMDNGEMRKELYGKPGAMRFKPYGVEYRVLSNFWIFTETLNKWAWDATEKAICDFESGRSIQELEEIVTTTINTNNKVVAAQMITDFNLLHV